MEILNLTPHNINIVDDNGSVITIIKPEEKPARLKVSIAKADSINGVPTSKSVFGEPQDLPNQVDGVYLIVSQIIKSAFPNRTDLLVPAELLRDESGAIIGCKSLGR